MTPFAGIQLKAAGKPRSHSSKLSGLSVFALGQVLQISIGGGALMKPRKQTDVLSGGSQGVHRTHLHHLLIPHALLASTLLAELNTAASLSSSGDYCSCLAPVPATLLPLSLM